MRASYPSRDAARSLIVCNCKGNNTCIDLQYSTYVTVQKRQPGETVKDCYGHYNISFYLISLEMRVCAYKKKGEENMKKNLLRHWQSDPKRGTSRREGDRRQRHPLRERSIRLLLRQALSFRLRHERTDRSGGQVGRQGERLSRDNPAAVPRFIPCVVSAILLAPSW